MQVLDGLLAFARGADAARSQTAFAPDELDASLEDLRPRLVGRDIAVDARAEEGYVACDPRLLRIVLSNLVDNAMKLSAGDRRGHVLVTGKKDGDSDCLEIEDDGPGIPKDAVARLFEPFYRVDGGRAPGTGLGLATVHRIVEAHGSSIEVVSKLGDGALFRVRLPSAAHGHRSAVLSSASRPSA